MSNSVEHPSAQTKEKRNKKSEKKVENQKEEREKKKSPRILFNFLNRGFYTIQQIHI